jgi:uncharacterized protein (TIGR02186 family)
MRPAQLFASPLALLLLALLPAPGSAETLVTSVSTPRVAIQSNFAGADVVVFGGIQRETGLATHGRYDVVITVRGPSGPLDVREKARVAGIWINRERRRYDDVPSFLALASTRPLTAIAEPAMIDKFRLSLDAAMDPAGAATADEADRTFRTALLRLKQGAGLYREQPQGVTFLSDDLFRATVALPANVPLGIYQVETRLLIDGVVVTGQRASLEVIKTGFEDNVAEWARGQSIAYGLFTVAMALGLGWLATVVFRRD